MQQPFPPGRGSQDDFAYVAHIVQARVRQMSARFPRVRASVDQVQRNNVLLDSPAFPAVLLQAVIVPGDKTSEGQLIEAVALPWFEIIDLITRSPDAIYGIDWRKWEEIIAGAYKQQGFDVELTPRSNDKGRDVIATKRGFGSVRFVDQVKAYRPGHVVTAEEVRAMVGVLSLQPNVSKGLVTTTSSFAPGIMKDPDIARFMPDRLELKGRDMLLEWLTSAAAEKK